ncbi:hypothetical protein B0H19DRAFT_1086168 [Mycena capillaripes]|nr:hypothetical protein B0H19DRAFT_1086168 [Mycena capillaripes]
MCLRTPISAEVCLRKPTSIPADGGVPILADPGLAKSRSLAVEVRLNPEFAPVVVGFIEVYLQLRTQVAAVGMMCHGADKPLINPDKPARVFETQEEPKLEFEIGAAYTEARNTNRFRIAPALTGAMWTSSWISAVLVIHPKITLTSSDSSSCKMSSSRCVDLRYLPAGVVVSRSICVSMYALRVSVHGRLVSSLADRSILTSVVKLVARGSIAGESTKARIICFFGRSWILANVMRQSVASWTSCGPDLDDPWTVHHPLMSFDHFKLSSKQLGELSHGSLDIKKSKSNPSNYVIVHPHPSMDRAVQVRPYAFDASIPVMLLVYSAKAAELSVLSEVITLGPLGIVTNTLSAVVDVAISVVLVVILHSAKTSFKRSTDLLNRLLGAFPSTFLCSSMFENILRNNSNACVLLFTNSILVALNCREYIKSSNEQATRDQYSLEASARPRMPTQSQGNAIAIRIETDALNDFQAVRTVASGKPPPGIFGKIYRNLLKVSRVSRVDEIWQKFVFGWKFLEIITKFRTNFGQRYYAHTRRGNKWYYSQLATTNVDLDNRNIQIMYIFYSSISDECKRGGEDMHTCLVRYDRAPKRRTHNDGAARGRAAMIEAPNAGHPHGTPVMRIGMSLPNNGAGKGHAMIGLGDSRTTDQDSWKGYIEPVVEACPRIMKATLYGKKYQTKVEMGRMSGIWASTLRNGGTERQRAGCEREKMRERKKEVTAQPFTGLSGAVAPNVKAAVQCLGQALPTLVHMPGTLVKGVPFKGHKNWKYSGSIAHQSVVGCVQRLQV